MRTSLIYCVGLCLAITSSLGCEGHQEPSNAVNSSPTSTSSIDQVEDKKWIRKVGAYEYVRYEDEPMVPAHRSLMSLDPLKADQYDDIRYYAPQNYALTQAPIGNIRPMVEWEPMTALFMAVPTYLTGDNYDNARNTIVQIAANSATVAEVWLLIEDSAGETNMTNLMLNAGVSQEVIDTKVKFLNKPFDSVWTIDFGPIPIIDMDTDTYALADFRYYRERALDDGVPTILGRSLMEIDQPSNTDTYRMPVNSEGGTFMATSDGYCFTGSGQLYWMSFDQGAPDDTIMSTLTMEELQTHPLAEEVRAVWNQYMGCKDTIITHSITDDGTLHLDMYFKVVSDDTVVVGEYVAPFEGEAEVNKARMDETAAFLASYQKEDGTGFNVKRLIMPGHRSSNAGPTPFTYANSTIINGLNLWPAYTFPDWEESRALAESQWQDAMPDHEHIWIDSEELAFWSGAIHCITRTIPAKTPGPWVGDGECSEEDTCTAPENGYTGACSPNGLTDQVCYGPEWLCTCNDCESGCTYEPGQSPCGNITYEGCCNGETLIWCENNAIETLDCSAQPSCGWSTDGFYNCGTDGSGDPSGAAPIACDLEGVELPEEPQGCGDITYEGCCDGQVLTWCENGALDTIDCGENPSCGWNAEDGFYNCGTDGAEEPSGTYPLTCGGVSGCTPVCDGKTCGDDGCGGVCGECAEGQLCNEADSCVDVAECTATCADISAICGTICGEVCGECVAEQEYCFEGSCQCIPSCAGKACGDDGCGGSCGTCGADEVCDDMGQCECVPSCDGKQCGSDGCSGLCGSCGADEVCGDDGQCTEAPCIPACLGKTCGDDGCGAVCGECTDGTICNANGVCVAGSMVTPPGDVTAPTGTVDGTENAEITSSSGGCSGAGTDSPMSAAILTLLTLGLWLRRRVVPNAS